MSHKSESSISSRRFDSIDIADTFFDTLKSSYEEFDSWFKRKADQGEYAYVAYSDTHKLTAFLYLKVEQGPITDIIPSLNVERCLKVGTFKIDAHGTRLGERFVKIIVDTALNLGLRHAYLTVFPEHEHLVRILETFGFKKFATKNTRNGIEDVYIKDMNYHTGDIILDYPMVDTRGRNKWLLGIFPEFHTSLFPDSKLKTESGAVVQDLSHTNSIHKIYIGFAVDLQRFQKNDCIVVYRCQAKASEESAWFKSVATSLCVVEEVMPKRKFKNENEFVQYCMKNSVFTRERLSDMYNARKTTELHAIKMTYNLAFPKRPNLKSLVESGAVPHPGTGAYYGLMKLSDERFKTILDLGNVNASFVIY